MNVESCTALHFKLGVLIIIVFCSAVCGSFQLFKDIRRTKSSFTMASLLATILIILQVMVGKLTMGFVLDYFQPQQFVPPLLRGQRRGGSLNWEAIKRYIMIICSFRGTCHSLSSRYILCK